MLCHRGCGLDSQYTNYKDLPCCNKDSNKCPIVAKKKRDSQIGIPKPTVSKALKGRKLPIEHRNNITSGLLKRNYKPSIETIEKIRSSNITTKAQQNIIPWNKGKKGLQVPWNKGKRKKETLEIISRTDPVYVNFKKYRNRVAVRTRKTYEKYKDEINPNNFKIGKSGLSGAYQIDHIISVRLGFEKGITVEDISKKENLQVIPWLDNNKKYDGKRKAK